MLAGGGGDAVQVDVHVDDVLRQHHGHDHQGQQANLCSRDPQLTFVGLCFLFTQGFFSKQVFVGIK